MVRHRIRFLGTLLAVLVMSPTAHGQIGPSPDAEAYVRRSIGHFIRGELDQGVQMLDQSTLPSDVDAVAEQIHELLKGLGPQPTISRVYWWGMQSFTRSFRADEFVFHVVGTRTAVLAFTRVETTNGKPVLKVFRCEAAPVDLRDRYPFVLWGVSPLHYLFLVLLVLVPASMVVCAYLAARSRIRRKWIWVPLSIVGLGQVSLSWIPGPFAPAMLETKLLHIALFGFGIAKYPIYDPWSVSFSLPVGALLVYLRLKRAAADEAMTPMAPDDTSEPERSVTPNGGTGAQHDEAQATAETEIVSTGQDHVPCNEPPDPIRSTDTRIPPRE